MLGDEGFDKGSRVEGVMKTLENTWGVTRVVLGFYGV